MIKNVLKSWASLWFALGLLFNALIQPAVARLVAWYPLDEAHEDAPSAIDAIGGGTASLTGYNADAGLTLVLRGQPSVRPAFGTAYQFIRPNTTSGGGLNLGNGAAVQPTNRFTISFWFQLTGLNAFARFLESQSGNANAQHGIRIDTGAAPGNHLRVLMRSGVAANTQLAHSRVLQTDGTWYFAAFRYDAGSSTDPFSITLVEATTDSITDAEIAAATEKLTTLNTGVLNTPHARPTLVGMELPGANNANNLNGYMDNLAFHDDADGNGVLSDAQLAMIYNLGPQRSEVLIHSFTADVSKAASGAPVTLEWTVAGGLTALTLSDGVDTPIDVLGLTSGGMGSLVVNPTATTTWTLAATRDEVTVTKQVTVLVGEAPRIHSFTASPPLVFTAAPVTLAWSTMGADTLMLNPGAQDVTGLSTIVKNPTLKTTYTLVASNAFGSSFATVTVTVTTGAVPVHGYLASDAGNNPTNIWRDRLGSKNLALLNGLVLEDPLTTASANTSLTATYRSSGLNEGGTASSYTFTNLSAELWVRPGPLTADYQVILENGGAQNGTSVLINDTEIRFLGSITNLRTIDLTIPLFGLNLDDFMQIVYGHARESGDFVVSVCDTDGNVRTASAISNVVVGVNDAAVFQLGAGGGVANGINNLGGRTEVPGALPDVVAGFAGEIAAINIYDRLLTEHEIAIAFDLVATVTKPPPLRILDYTFNSDNTARIQWNSRAGRFYVVEFSLNLADWLELEDPFQVEEENTTRTFQLPPADKMLFIRILEVPGR